MAEACRAGEECSLSKNKPAAFLGSPLPLPAQPSILAAQDAREGGGEQGRGSELVLLTNPEKERERGRGLGEGEKEIALYGNIGRQYVAMVWRAAEVRYQTDGRN